MPPITLHAIALVSSTTLRFACAVLLRLRARLMPSAWTFSMRRFLVALISITITSLLPWNGIAQPTKLKHLKPVEITELGPGKDNASEMECYYLNGPEIIMERGRVWNRKILRQKKHSQDEE